MSGYENKLLVPLDGSGRSLETVHYLIRFDPFKEFEPVLYNVMNRVPESYYDLRSDDFNLAALSRLRVLENSRKAMMEEFMTRSMDRLIAGGFKPDQVHIRITGREKGVARDILAEAGKGYHALVIRRRGWTNAVLPLALGSVSTKVLEKAADIPVILAGVQPRVQNMLIAFDGSPGAMNAVDFVARTTGNSQCRVTLGIVIRDGNDMPGPGSVPGPDDLSEDPGKALDRSVDKAVDILSRAGIPMDRIQVRTSRGVKSRALALADMAASEECGSLVLGRRGQSNVTDFSIGRVPWKVVHGVRKMTAWVVP